MGSLFFWWFVVTALGVLALPLVFNLFRFLPDRGYAFSKPCALLLVAVLTWLASHVIGYTTRAVYVAVLVVGALSYWLLSRSWTALAEFLQNERKYVWIVEAVFLGAFLMAGAYKMRTFDIGGTEKPMDFAFVNAILAAPQMPPQDPWLSGGHISYYYGGYFVVATMAKLTATTPGVAYNLGVALVWALAALGGFGLGYALTRKYVYAAFPAVALTALGNLDFWHRAVQSFLYGDLRASYYNQPADPNVSGGVSGLIAYVFGPVERHWDYFQASRIVVVPPQDKLINEFPAFSFFLSDLHPHLMSLPFVLLTLALAFNLLKSPLGGLEIFGRDRLWQIAQWVLVALIFGALGFINSWDLPTLMLILGLSLALQQSWAAGALSAKWFASLALVGLPVVAAAFVFYLPFYGKLQSQAEGIGFGPDRTDIYYLCVIFGLFFAVIIPAVGGRAALAAAEGEFEEDEEEGAPKRARRAATECVMCRRRGSIKNVCKFCGGETAPSVDAPATAFVNETLRYRLREIGAWLSPAGKSAHHGVLVTAAIAFVLLIATLGTVNLATLALSALIVAFAMISLATEERQSKELIFATLLTVIGFSLIALCELFYVKDVFQGGGLRRMNTVFKFHYQVWVLLSVAAAPFLQWLIERRWPEWLPWQRQAWAAVACFALLGAAMYPLLTSDTHAARNNDVPLTLDGSYNFRRNNAIDAGAVEWISQNVRAERGGKIPVVLEAWGGSYSEYARLSTRTGIPTVLGWDGHENQWRGSDAAGLIRGGRADDTLDSRRRDVDAIYTTLDLQLARDLLKKYGVDYVYVGGLEREKYKSGAAGLEKFAQLGTPVYSQGTSTLYRINN